MTVGELESLLNEISNNGYGDWAVFMCDDDDDNFSINHIYIDSDGDLCLESTDAEDDTYDFTCDNVLNRIKKYSDDTYVYFLEEYEDESSNIYDIDDGWYIGTNWEGDDILNIDCFPCDDDDDDYCHNGHSGSHDDDNSDLENLSEWDIW